MIRKSTFGDYDKFTISSDELEVSLVTLGATVQDLRFHCRPLILNYPTPEGYLTHDAYVGGTIGRFANRIRNARFTLDGKEYVLPPNDGVHQIHGGPNAFDRQRWQAEILSNQSLRMTYLSPDGENGFPGNLKASLTVSVSGAELRFDFDAETDQPTPYSPTTHLYFCLVGEGSVYDTLAQINTSGYLECDADVVPTGKILPPVGDFDFSAPRRIRRPYDDCILLSSEDACTMSGREVSVSMRTDFPALLFYTWEFPEEPERKEGGFTLEPHFYPDSVNHPEWPSSILRPGEQFHHYAAYTFQHL